MTVFDTLKQAKQVTGKLKPELNALVTKLGGVESFLGVPKNIRSIIDDFQLIVDRLKTTVDVVSYIPGIGGVVAKALKPVLKGLQKALKKLKRVKDLLKAADGKLSKAKKSVAKIKKPLQNMVALCEKQQMLFDVYGGQIKNAPATGQLGPMVSEIGRLSTELKGMVPKVHKFGEDIDKVLASVLTASVLISSGSTLLSTLRAVLAPIEFVGKAIKAVLKAIGLEALKAWIEKGIDWILYQLGIDLSAIKTFISDQLEPFVKELETYVTEYLKLLEGLLPGLDLLVVVHQKLKRLDELHAKVHATWGGQGQGKYNISHVKWSKNKLTFLAAGFDKVYVKFFDCDGGYDYDESGKKLGGVWDSDSQIGAIRTVTIKNGLGSIDATGSARNSGDTYGIIYRDPACKQPMRRSNVMP